VNNFKSYRGEYKIGPLKSFTAVIGPNGSGKSNFMDAISFVMGENTRSLRVKRLSDLIHGASIGKPASRHAHVTAVFEMADGSGERRFTRTVHGSTSEHRINDKPVVSAQYMRELEELGINVKGKNFLVFQGAVESIAMKNPKERTSLFEELSGSGALKKHYDDLKDAMLKAESDTTSMYQKKKGIQAETKEAKSEKAEAMKYQKLKEDLVQKQIELQLFRLFYNEQDMEQFEKEIKRKKEDLARVEAKKKKAEEAHKKQLNDYKKVTKEMSKVEQDIRELETLVSKKRPNFIKAKEGVAHNQSKLDAAQKNLKQATKAHNAHTEQINELQDELNEVERKSREFEEEVRADSESQGRSVQLDEVLVKEYHKLKRDAAKQSARLMQELETINRDQKSDQDRLDNSNRRAADFENKVRGEKQKLEEEQRRREKLEEHIKAAEDSLEEQLTKARDLKNNVGESKDRIARLHQELDSISEQLGDARVDKHEDTRRRKRQEIVQNFKNLYPGVYDRMINMCTPIHKRYNVAITKVLGKFMEAIVVDTEKTARQCVQYLKDQMLDPETFLPLDYIQAKALKERLRDITDPPNVKLVYDVLQYDPPEIKRAVLFATNNALVCERTEDASRVAYDLEPNHRYDAVALDGTFFFKSGIISGGSLDLARKAKRWDEKQMLVLKNKKEKLSEELREAMKNSRKESDLNTVESQIRGIESKLKYTRSDRDNCLREIARKQQEVDRLTADHAKHQPALTEIEQAMKRRDEIISTKKDEMNNVEDVLFKSFCEKIGVEDIRQYEDRELRAQTERANKRMEFQNQMNRLSSQLEFESSRNTEGNVKRWEKSVENDKALLEKAKLAEKKQLEELDSAIKEVTKLKEQQLHKKAEVQEADDQISAAKAEVAAVQKEVAAANKAVNGLEHKANQKRIDRHSILKQCKMDDTLLPMTRGSMGDIENEGGEANLEYSSGMDTQVMFEREASIVLDYSQLSEQLTELDEAEDVRKMETRLNRQLNDLTNHIHKIQAPNMKAMEKLDDARVKLGETNKEFENMRKVAKKAKYDFEKVKKERYEKFQAFFEHVSNEIDQIYKSLAKNPSAQAFLGPENPEEPYLDGINYNCVAPGKRFQPMSNLSGGEKTIAALALLFAVHSYQPAPFFVLDEIDAALDNTNIGKVASYITGQKAAGLQTIVISLKEEFYQNADALVGICPDAGECLVSRVLTQDLTGFALERHEADEPFARMALAH